MFVPVLMLVTSSVALAAPWTEMIQAKEANSSSQPMQHSFETFKITHGKSYSSPAEETRRRAIFEKNVELITAHNLFYDLGETSYYMGVNQFSDMTFEEWLSLYATPLPDYVKTGNDSTFLPLENFNAPPTVDWRKKGYVTPVKDQKKCGSCWAFSATGSLEGQLYRKSKKLVSLSEQQLVDCSRSYGNHGCQGGLMNRAFEYIKDKGGVEGESDYRYTGLDTSSCKFQKSKVKATVSGNTVIPEGSESGLQQAVASVGPVSVAIHVTQNFMHYKKGVFSDSTCNTFQLNHAVLAVGYGSTAGEYWLVKNSWGTTWGDQGYIQMARNKGNMCGIANMAIYPLV